MTGPRVIPVLLLRGTGLVKTEKFSSPRYVGDAINAVRIFNDKEADELILLDIDARHRPAGIAWNLLEDVASEASMPLCYGGGVRTLEHMHRIYRLGFEKIALSSVLFENAGFLAEAAREFGGQAVVAVLETRKSLLGRRTVCFNGGRNRHARDLAACAEEMQTHGAGELLLVDVERDGTAIGYDLEMVRSVTQRVTIPVIACGGAGQLAHLREVVYGAGAAAAAAGRLFVFYGKHRAVLITYPERAAIDGLFS